MKLPTYQLLILGLSLIFLGACGKEDRIRSKFIGAWEIERITIVEYEDGIPVKETVYDDCGTWAFIDNGSSGYTYNLSYLSMTKDVPCEFRSLLIDNKGRLEGRISWGPDPKSDERILFEHDQYDDGKSYTVEKISRNKFVFISITQDVNNADHIYNLQRFELKRSIN